MIALLIPVLGRAQQIQPLLASIAGSTTAEHQVVLIFSPGDEAIHAAKGTKATVLIAPWAPGKADYAKKLALGFAKTEEPWFFQGATDLIFHPQWDTEALKVHKQSHAGVIGTNDLGNPLVRRGVHSTHTLISRQYIEEWGGTADDTGLIFSEVYDHQWSDSEFIETARRRHQFAFAKKSIVEHMHPHWGKGQMDTTYDKALRATSNDMKTFARRRSKISRLDQLERRRHQ